jgi:hypothetical protein
MARIICKLCGKTGTSKCPVCRSVFLDDTSGTTEALISHVLKFEFHEEGILTLKYQVSPNDTVGDAVRDLLEILQMCGTGDGKQVPTLEQVFCDHLWQYQPGEKSSIGCKCNVPTKQA